MRVGEALTRRADLQKRIAKLPGRIQASAVGQEGDTPPEDADALLADFEELTAELARLIAAINTTNASSRLPDGRTVTECLALRDALTLRQNGLRSVVDSIGQSSVRYSRSEIRTTRLVDVGAIRRQIDDIARQQRELDATIQEHNWTTDLLEDASR
jgi:hypothetical protein